MTTHSPFRLFIFVVTVTTSEDLARDVDEQAEDGRDVAGNLRCASVPRGTRVVNALDGQEANVCGEQHCGLAGIVNLGEKFTEKSRMTDRSNSILPVSFQYCNEAPPGMIMDSLVDECRV